MKKILFVAVTASFVWLNSIYADSSVISDEPEVEEAIEETVEDLTETVEDHTETVEASGEALTSVFTEGEGDSDAKVVSADEEYGDDINSLLIDIPAAKRPKKADSEKVEAARKKDADNSEYEEYTTTLTYGTPTEINGIVDKIVEAEDPRYSDALYDLFQTTVSNNVREKILGYFANLEDPCLEDFAVEILDDPFDTPNSLVQQCMTYVSDVHSKAAAPALIKLLDSEEEKYFNGSLSAIGKTGGVKEARYLAKYLKRDDLETPQRQALMRTLGHICAVETFDEVVEIAQDEDENSFVRMYAAEAIGNMKKDEAIPVLVDMYQKGDPNMREYCIKGLQNFPKSEKARNTIVQGIRDEHVKVRLQSIKSAKEMQLNEAVDFLIYRAKNDNENAVKKECYPVIAAMDTKKGNEFLVAQLKEKKTPDSTRLMAAEAILKSDLKMGIDDIAELAKSVVNDDKRKPLRYGLGKAMSKYTKPAFAEVSAMYIQSKDAQTAALGLDMYKAGRYETAVASVKELAEDKTRNSTNRKRARKLLGMEEDDEKENVKEPVKKPEPAIKPVETPKPASDSTVDAK